MKLMTITAAIATKLNVLESAIVKVEEWAHVMFVVVKGLGARFVSKKVTENKKMELAALEGSDKQVEWAEQIRASLLLEIKQLLVLKQEDLQDYIEDKNNKKIDLCNLKIDKLKRAAEFLYSCKSARFIIDCRNHDGMSLADVIISA